MKMRTKISLIVASVVALFASCNQNSSNLQNAPTSSAPDSSEQGLIGSPFDLDDTTFYSAVEPFDDPGGLRIAGPNSSERIRACTSINGLSIAELEELMRPGQRDERTSKEGFLGPEERLLDVLAADNDLVNGMGLSHRDLAIPLLQICQRVNGRLNEGDDFEFDHANIRWRVECTVFMGSQLSPFNDQTKASIDYTLTNLENGESVSFSGLVPLMIERYGFYEGHGTPYRVEPTDIARVLGLTK